jgi:hypothetical protein
MQLSTSEAVKLMKKLEISFTECKHHVRGFLVVDGKRVLAVHCSRGRKDLPGNVPHLFRRSLHLTIDEFEFFRSCRMSLEAYVELLRDKGVIS